MSLIRLEVKKGESEKSEEKKVDTTPESFLCSISAQLMEEPLIWFYGQSAERAGIIRWIAQQQRTAARNQLTLKECPSNSALKHLIRYYNKVKDSDEFKKSGKFDTKELMEYYQALGLVMIQQLEAYLKDMNEYLQSFQDAVRMTLPPRPKIIDWPFALICPLSHELLKKSFITPYGNTYEKSAIDTWLARHEPTTDPLADKPLLPKQLVVNINLNDSLTLCDAKELESALKSNETFKTQLKEIQSLISKIHEADKQVQLTVKEQARLADAEKRRKLMLKYTRYTFAATVVVTIAGAAYYLMADACRDFSSSLTPSTPDSSAPDSELTPAASSFLIKIGGEFAKPYIASSCTLVASFTQEFIDLANRSYNVIRDFFDSQHRREYEMPLLYSCEAPSLSANIYKCYPPEEPYCKTLSTPPSDCIHTIYYAIKHHRRDLLLELFNEKISHAYFTQYITRKISDNDLGTLQMLRDLNPAILTFNPIFLIVAVAEGRAEIAELLLKNGISVDARADSRHDVYSFYYSDGRQCKWDESCTALHFAAGRNDSKMIKLLLQYHADINARDKLGNTPLYRAIVNRCYEAIDIFKYRASFSTPDMLDMENLLIETMDKYFLTSPFEKEKYLGLIKILLKHGVKANNIYSNMRLDTTYLTIWSNDKNIELATLLLDAGAPVNPVFNPKDYRLSPLEIALLARAPKLVALLLVRGADLQETLNNYNYRMSYSAVKLPESWLMELIDSINQLEKLPAQSRETKPRLKGLIALFQYAVQKDYVSVAEKLLKRTEIGTHADTIKELITYASTFKYTTFKTDKIQALLNDHLKKIAAPTYSARFFARVKNVTQSVTEIVEDIVLTLTH